MEGAMLLGCAGICANCDAVYDVSIHTQCPMCTSKHYVLLITCTGRSVENAVTEVKNLLASTNIV